MLKEDVWEDVPMHPIADNAADMATHWLQTVAAAVTAVVMLGIAVGVR